MFLLGIHEEINRRAAINQVRERVISLWTQITKQHSRPDPKSFLDFPIIYKIFSFLFLSDSIDSTYTQAAATRGTFLLALAREHFFRMLQGLSECCTCGQSQVLQQNR